MISATNPFYALPYANIASLFGAAAASPSGVTATIGGSSSTSSISSTNDPAKAIQAILAQADVAKAPAAADSASGVSSTVESAYAAQTSLKKVSGSFDDPSWDTYDAVSKIDFVQQAYTPQAGAAAPPVAASTSSALSVAAQKIYDEVSAVKTPGITIMGQTYGISDSSFAMSTISQDEAGTRTETADVLQGQSDGRTLIVAQSAAMINAASDAEDSQKTMSASSAYASSGGSAPASPGQGPNGPLALRVSIGLWEDPGAGIDGAYDLAKAQAKQLVSSFEQYLAQGGSPTASGLSLFENYAGSQIAIDASLVSDSGPTDLPTSIEGSIPEQSGALRLRMFMVPLSSPKSTATTSDT